MIESEADLAALCIALGARDVAGLSISGRYCVFAKPPKGAQIGDLTAQIRAGGDPLGEWFCRLRSGRHRRALGATYTPAPIVSAMVRWAQTRIEPLRVVDPGVGSGRFLVAAARAFPHAKLVGVEIDPLAALMARATLATAGFADRAEIHLADYRDLSLDRIDGPTLFIGNPPYVRHHQIAFAWKAWLSRTAARYELAASQLAGLHAHFFLATRMHARPGDVGSFITAAEWLDVNYGALVRSLLARDLGLCRLDIIEPTAQVFEDAQATAVIAGFEIQSATTAIDIRRIASASDLAQLSGGRRISRQRLLAADRWTPLSRASKKIPSGMVELGELCRVHRGQVTGANAVWISGPDTPTVPRAFLRPSITRARELFDAGQSLESADHLRCVIDLPTDLASLSPHDRVLVNKFIRWAHHHRAHENYIARHRQPWWSVRLREPAPILATYMARRPPAFVRNRIAAGHINIAHGIYPREPLAPTSLDALAHFLSRNVSVESGRTYAGGLTKFEPREMQRLLVPAPQLLAELSEARSPSGTIRGVT